MALYSIFVVNTAPGCDNIIEQQLTVSGCTNYIIRLASNSNALGPFDIYLDSILPANILYSAVTRYDMFNGVVVEFECTLTPTPSNTATPTPTVTTGLTPTPTETPSATPTQTPSISATASETPTSTSTPTGTPTQTQTQTQTPSNTPTGSPAVSSTPTETPTQTQTQTPTTTTTLTATPTETPTQTPTQTQTQTQTQTSTTTTTLTATPTETPTETPTQTQTPTTTTTLTATATETPTPTETPTQTQTPTTTTTLTATETATPTETPTQTQTMTPSQTETPTPTLTPTLTQTMTPSQTETPTPSVTPTLTQTPTTSETPTQTPSPTPTIAPLFAYIFIDTNGTQSKANLSAWMTSQGSAWRGFNQVGSPSTVQGTFDAQMNAYLSYSGWNGNITTGGEPAIITASVSPTSGGVDAYGNAIVAYKFQTVQIPIGAFTATTNNWVTVFASTGSTNGQKYSTINNGTGAGSMTPKTMSTTYNGSAPNNLIINYSGSTNIPAGTYRMYSTYVSTDFRLTTGLLPNYFQGGTLI